MANPSFPLSRDARVYYDTADTLLSDSMTATSWLALNTVQEANLIRNLSMGLDSNLADTNTRESTAGGFQSQTPILKSGEISFDTPWDLGDVFITKLVSAWASDGKLAMAVLNRSKSNLATDDVLNGFIGNFFVTLTKEENVDDVQRANWTLTHSDEGVWYSVVTPGA